MQGTENPKISSLWIQILVCYTAIAVTSWSMPYAPQNWSNWATAPLQWNQDYIKPLVLHFVYWTGLHQNTRLFATDPSLERTFDNLHEHSVYAQLVYKDGMTANYEFTATKDLSILQRMFEGMRFNKIRHGLNAGTPRDMLRSFAIWVAKKNTFDANNPVIRVFFVERNAWTEAILRGESKVTEYVFYRRSIAARELQ